MALNNLLYVDDDPDWLEIGQRRFQGLTPNVDVAEDYASALQKIRQTKYDLIILDSLEGDCFRIHRDIQEIPHGEIILFSGNSQIKGEAKRLGIPFYDKMRGLSKLMEAYKE